MNRPKIALLSIKNNYHHGGVFATLKVAYDFCKQYFDPTVFVLSFDKEISAHVRPLQFSSTTRKTSFAGMPCIEIGSRWAFWEPGHYSFTKHQWQQALEGYDYFFVVSATPIAAHPLVLLNKKFLLWASTTYREDRSERVKQLRGMRWLTNALSEHTMNSIEYTILDRAAALLPLSAYAQRTFGAVLQPQKRIMSLCGYPIEYVASHALKQHYRTVVAVGRFKDPRKNFSMLMDAFGKLSQLVPGVKMVVVGQLPSPDILAHFVYKPWYDNISFLGEVDDHTLKAVYEASSVMLITSHQEGLGIVGLEAMAAGIPVVTTDCGGVADYVIEGKTGFIVARNDTQAMAERASELLVQQELYAQCAMAAQALVRDTFSKEHVYHLFQKNLLAIYPELSTLFLSSQVLYEDAHHQPYLHHAA